MIGAIFNTIYSSEFNFECSPRLRSGGLRRSVRPRKRALRMKSCRLPGLRGAHLAVSVPQLIRNSYIKWPLAFCSPTIYACGAASWGPPSRGLLLRGFTGVSASLFDSSLRWETVFADFVSQYFLANFLGD